MKKLIEKLRTKYPKENYSIVITASVWDYCGRLGGELEYHLIIIRSGTTIISQKINSFEALSNYVNFLLITSDTQDAADVLDKVIEEVEV